MKSVISQDGFVLGKNLEIHIYDNASDDSAFSELKKSFSQNGVFFKQFENNLGFSGASNIAAKEFVNSDKDNFLLLNPDLRLERDALGIMQDSFQVDMKVGVVTPKIFKADKSLNPLVPKVLDAAGMYVTPSLRHFDRGSGLVDSGQFDKPAYVFGGTGACLLMKRDFVLDVSKEGFLDEDLKALYPNLCSCLLYTSPSPRD